MRIDEKLYICEKRLEHKSVHEIAKELGISFQSVHFFLTKLPRSKERKNAIRPPLEKDTMLQICKMYLDGAEQNKIAEKCGVSMDEIEQVFTYIVQKKNKGMKKTYLYPSLIEYMDVKNMSAKTFAEAVGIKRTKLIKIFNGVTEFSFDEAERVRAFTGLSFTEIYSEVYVNDMEKKNTNT